jgi:phospholipase/carboxylesterase
MSDELLSCIESETAPTPDASVIWLHGLGADGSDFVPILPELALPPALAVRFVFPNAPVRSVTINNGMRMRAWYDIVAADLSNRADLEGVRQSARSLDALIERERQRGVASERIVLAGFSQGGAIALYAGLRYGSRLGGIMALSTYLIGAEAVAHEASAANRAIPIFMAHGTADPVVRFQWAEASRRVLEAQGYAIEWRSYRMEHSVCFEEVQAIGAWLVRVLSSTQPA